MNDLTRNERQVVEYLDQPHRRQNIKSMVAAGCTAREIALVYAGLTRKRTLARAIAHMIEQVKG